MLKYELIKIWCNKKTRMLFLLVTVLMCTLFYFTQVQEGISLSVYREVHQEVDKLKIGDAQKHVQELYDKNEFYHTYAFSESVDARGNEDYYIEKYGQAWVVDRKKEATSNLIDVDQKEQVTYQAILKEIDNIVQYSQYREGILQQYEDQKSISIFKNKEDKQSTWTYETYKNLDVTHDFVLQPTKGTESIFQFFLFDILLLFLILYVVSSITMNEKLNGFSLLASSQAEGGRKQILSKYVALFLTTIILLLLNTAVLVLMNHFLYGDTHMGIAIQSISSFFKTPYNLSLIQFSVLYIGIRILAYACICALLTFFASYARSYLKFILYTILAIGISYVVCIQQNPVYFLSIWQYCRADVLLGNYEFINLLGMTIPLTYAIVLLPLASLLFLILSVNGFRQVKSSKRKRWFHKKTTCISLQLYEMKKVWFKSQALLLVLLAVIVHGYTLMNTKPTSTIHDMYYNYYVDTIGKSVTIGSEKRLVEREAYFQELHDQVLIAKDPLIQMDLNNKLYMESDFILYKHQFQKVKESKDNREIVKEDQYRLLLSDSFLSKESIIIFLIVIIYLCITQAHTEKESRVELLQQVSVNGSKPLRRANLMSVGSVVTVLLVIIQVMNIIWNHKLFPDISYSMPLYSLSQFFDSEIYISIGVYLCIALLVQIGVGILIAGILSKITRKYNYHYILLCILTLLLVMPIFIMDWLPFFYTYSLYSVFFFHSLERMGNLVVLLVIWILIVLCYTYFMRKNNIQK